MLCPTSQPPSADKLLKSLAQITESCPRAHTAATVPAAGLDTRQERSGAEGTRRRLQGVARACRLARRVLDAAGRCVRVRRCPSTPVTARAGGAGGR